MSQFFHIHPDNPQQRLLKQAAQIILQGGVVIYPTDSGYALGCAVGNKNAMERIQQIRQVSADHDFTLACRDLSELSVYAKVENSAFRLIKNNTPGAYTFILRATKEVPKRLQNPKRKTIGLRVPNNPITLALLEALGEPLMSGSLIMPNETEAEYDPQLIREQLEKLVDLIIDGGVLDPKPTTVIELYDDTPVIARVGAGDTTPFE